MFQEKGIIIQNQSIIPDDIYKLTVRSPQIATNAKPGQFIMVLCQDKQTLLRRPFSVSGMNIDSQKKLINIIYKVIGLGTKWMTQLIPSDTLDIIGPLGNGYQLIRDKKVLILGGGIGIASVLAIAEDLTKDNIHILFGCQTLDAQCAKQIKNLFPKILQGDSYFTFTTDDGNYGQKGMVTNILAEIIQEKGIEQIYACGPEMMLKKVAQISQKINIPCQVSLEEKMACGIGACLSCACRVGGTNKRVCADGPVFNAKEVDWL